MNKVSTQNQLSWSLTPDGKQKNLRKIVFKFFLLDNNIYVLGVAM